MVRLYSVYTGESLEGTGMGGAGLEEEKMIEAFRKGDKKAFELMVEKYHNELYYTALSLTRSGWDALDLCQETFIKAYTSINTLKDGAKFRAWISRILVNKCKDFFRKNKKIVLVEDIEKEGFFEDSNIENMDLLKAISALKEDHRIVITLRYFQDLSIREIAEITGSPEGTVKSRLSYGLKELRRNMKAKTDTEVV